MFASALKRLRLELSTLKRELEGMQSNLDPLTGTYGRTSLFTVLRELQALVERNVIPCSVVMMDLDHFKAINDTYGHQAGDSVLAAAAQRVMQQLRSYDKMFRYGGEEFVVSLQNADLDTATRITDRLREHLGSTSVCNGDARIPVTVSCGVAQLQAGITVEESVDRADRALYIAKSDGRNCTRTWRSAGDAS